MDTRTYKFGDAAPVTNLVCIRAASEPAFSQATAIEVTIFRNPNGHLNLQIQGRRAHHLLWLRRILSRYSIGRRIPCRHGLSPEE